MKTLKDFLIEGDVVKGNFGSGTNKNTPPQKEKPTPSKMSMIEIFGSSSDIILDKLGVSFYEKPHDFNVIKEKKPISRITFQQIKNEFKKNTIPLIAHSSQEIFGKDPTYPMEDIKKRPVGVYVIEFQNGDSYLVTSYGASSYIRMWAYLDF